MADFCQQCSIDTFGEDFRDLAIGDEARESHDPVAKPSDRYIVQCEGCNTAPNDVNVGGYVVVDKDGRCVVDCTSHHGTETMETWQGLAEEGDVMGGAVPS